MTRLAVKDKIKHELRGNTILEFHDSENHKVNVQDDNWCTAEFHVNTAAKTTFCGSGQEQGIITVWCFGRAGVGSKWLQEKAEQLAIELFNSQDSTPSLELHMPYCTTTESDQHGDFVVVITMPYAYWW